MKIIAERPISQGLKDRIEWQDFLHAKHCQGGKKCKYFKLDKRDMPLMQCEWIVYDISFEDFMTSKSHV